jgi:long-chain acyl-CoA synthetase
MAQNSAPVELGNVTSHRVWQWLVTRYPDRQLSLETKLQEDLGIDSIEWMDVGLSLGRECGVALRDDALTRMQTAGDLLHVVNKATPLAANQRSSPSPIESPEEVLRDESRFWLSPLRPIELAGGWCIHASIWALMRLLFRLRISGAEHLPVGTSFVLAPHHTSYLDSMALGAALPFGVMKQSYWAAWTGVAFSPIWRFLRRLTHVVPVDVARGAVSSLAYGAAVLKRRHNLIWFPEGRISPSSEVLPLKPGLGLLLARYPLPVVLVRIEGTREALPHGHLMPRLGKVRIVFSRPLDSLELDRTGVGGELHERITDALHSEMVRFCETSVSSPPGVDEFVAISTNAR